jgi:adenosylcobinamide-GDP ribazoletransferase
MHLGIHPCCEKIGSGFGTALKTLSLFPWIRGQREDFAASLYWFPVIGLVLGTILYGITVLLRHLPIMIWPEGAAVIIIIIEALVTRGLHMDGLADWADSFGGFKQREKRLEIMKDASLGAFGVLALILALMAKWVAYTRLFESGAMVWVLALFALSRDMMVDLITRLPYARKGEGMASPFVGHGKVRHRNVSHGIALVICLFFGPLGILFFAFGLIAVRLLGMHFRGAHGGITGDLLGAANEMVGTSLLVVCAVWGKGIVYYTGWQWILH